MDSNSQFKLNRRLVNKDNAASAQELKLKIASSQPLSCRSLAKIFLFVLFFVLIWVALGKSMTEYSKHCSPQLSTMRKVLTWMKLSKYADCYFQPEPCRTFAFSENELEIFSETFLPLVGSDPSSAIEETNSTDCAQLNELESTCDSPEEPVIPLSLKSLASYVSLPISDFSSAWKLEGDESKALRKTIGQVDKVLLESSKSEENSYQKYASLVTLNDNLSGDRLILLKQRIKLMSSKAKANAESQLRFDHIKNHLFKIIENHGKCRRLIKDAVLRFDDFDGEDPFQKKVDQLEKQVKKAKSNLNSALKQHEDKQKSLEEGKSKLEEQLQKLAQTQKERDRILKSIKSNEEELVRQKKKASEVAKNHSELAKIHDQNSSELSKKKEQLEQLKKKISAVNGVLERHVNNSELVNELVKIAQIPKLPEYNSQMTDMISKMKDLSNIIKKEKENLVIPKELEKGVEELKESDISMFKESTKKWLQLQKKAEDLEKWEFATKKFQEKLRAFEDQKQNLQTQIIPLESKAFEEKNQLRALDTERSALADSIANIEKVLKIEKQRIPETKDQDFEAQLSAAKNEIEKTSEDFKKTSEGLKKKLSAAEKNLASHLGAQKKKSISTRGLCLDIEKVQRECDQFGDFFRSVKIELDSIYLALQGKIQEFGMIEEELKADLAYQALTE